VPIAPSRVYRIPGFRVALVREPGVALAERPLVQTPRDVAPLFAEYIGDRDREVFALALLTIRRRVIGLHTVAVGCLSSTLVHPRLCSAEHKRGYVAAALMWHPSCKRWRGFDR